MPQETTSAPPAPAASVSAVPVPAAPAPAASAAPAPPPAITPVATPPGIDWLPGADELTIGLVQNKKWAGPADAVKAYQNAQSLIGANPDSVLRIPGDGADKATIDAFFNKMGRPAEAKSYDIPTPDGQKDTAMADWAKGVFHEAGLTAAQAKAIGAKWNEQNASQAKTQADAKAAVFETQNAALKQEWGAAYDKNRSVVDNAVNAFGVTEPQLIALRDAMGPAAAMKFMHNLGSRLGEDQFLSGDQKAAGFSVLMTPQMAMQKITELRGDKDWVKGYIAGSAEKKAQMVQLQQWANPEG